MKIEGAIDVSALLRCGVYVLQYRGEVVYVGKAREGLTRLYTHRSVWSRNRSRSAPKWLPTSVRGILYDAAHFIPCAADRMDELERSLINRFKPKLNIALKDPGPISSPIALTVAGVSLTLNQGPIAGPSSERIRRRA